MLVRIQMGTNTAENQQQRLSLILLRNREFISRGTNNQYHNCLENNNIFTQKLRSSSLALHQKTKIKKTRCTLFECQVIQHKNANWGHYFYVSNWRRDCHFTWSSEPREGLAACSAKEVPSFLGYFKTQSIGPAPRIGPGDLPLCSQTLSRLS